LPEEGPPIEEFTVQNERAARKTRAYLLTQKSRFLQDHEKARAALDRALATLDGRLETKEGKELLAQVAALEKGLGIKAESLMERRARGLTAEEAGRLLELEIQPDRDELDAVVESLERHKRRVLEAAKEAAAQNAARASIILWLTIGASVLLSGTLAFLLVRSYRHVAQAADFQQRVIAIVGHDLRSPLAAILASASHVLSKASLDEKFAGVIARVLRAARRIEILAKLLVDFTQAKSTFGLSIVPQQDNLHEVCEQVVDEFRLSHPNRTITLEKNSDGRGDFDRDKLVQVVANLIDNALRHGATDTPIEVRTDGSNPSVLELSVVNRGEPIPPKLLPHIFEPFRYGERPETAAVRESLGMGLYIVAEVVKAHGGRVAATSKDGKTTLTVLLPRVPVAPERRVTGPDR
jgi:signal transduction histidine kinase